ncbi:hypothetical protein [Pelagibacterium limicola]|uniref:hypothetical protein n=1 Tax=Pelagibacterium limicola TaxID=2791022 RepID=UPI0018AFA892|nr:hypothetical protein [Pelagibacterium limicola]
MLIKHSSSVMVHQLALKEAQSPQTMLALVARMRAQMELDLVADIPEAPRNDIEAAEKLVDRIV